MAFKLDFTKCIRNLTVLMNMAIALLMALGFWIFLTNDGIFTDPSWLIWLPLAALIFIGIPLWITWSLFSDGSQNLRMAFLILNLLAFGLVFTAAFIDQWVTASPDMPFSLHSLGKICLILGTPFLVNIMTLLFLLSRKRMVL